VLKEMEAGIDRLPIVVIDGQIASTGLYPSRAQLAQKLGFAVDGAPATTKSGGCGCSGGKC